MRMRPLTCFVILICLAFAPLRADEKTEGYLSSCTHVVDSGGFGYCGNSFLYRNVVKKDLRTFQVPVASFGVHKQPGKRSRYTYLILFKTAGAVYKGLTEHGGKFSTNVTSTTFGLSSDGRGRVTLNQEKGADKVIDIAWQHETDKQTGAITREVIKLGGIELQKDAPRVYLVDLTKDQVVFQPVKAALPSEAPDTQQDDKAWKASVLKGIEELKKSAEVKEFFERASK